MTIWQIIAILTPAVGALAIVYALRFFPAPRVDAGQLDFDFQAPKDYAARRRTSMAHDIDRTTDLVREETARIKAKPRLKP